MDYFLGKMRKEREDFHLHKSRESKACRDREGKEHSGALLVSRALEFHPLGEEGHVIDGSVSPYSARKKSRPAFSAHTLD